MRCCLATVPMLALVGCSNPPAGPAGLYRLSMEDKSMTLDLRTGGDYVLQIDAPGRNTDEIRGRWEERGQGRDLSLHGIVWRGTEPEPGADTWSTRLHNHADICLDGEAGACFTRDGDA